MNNHFIFLDTETTGLNPQLHGIISVSGLITNLEFEILEEFDLVMRPPLDCEIDLKALQINRYDINDIRPKNLTNYKYLSDRVQYQKLCSILEKYNLDNRWENPILVGYNINFDYSMLLAWEYRVFKNPIGEERAMVEYTYKSIISMLNHKKIDVMGIWMTYRFANKLYDHKDNLKSACQYFGIKYEAHKSIDDIKATYDLFKKITKIGGNLF